MPKTLRTRKVFCWWPRFDNNKIYWLKTVQIVEKLVIYKIVQWPLIPWGFGGPHNYYEYVWKCIGIVDESDAIEIFVPDKDSPEP